MRIAQYGIVQDAWNRSYRQRQVSSQTKVSEDTKKALVFKNILDEERQKNVQEDLINLDLVGTLIAILSGQKLNQQSWNQSNRFYQANTNVEMTVLETTSVHTAMTFTSTGVVQTESGEIINYTCNVSFSKSYFESVKSTVRSNNFIDPLVFNIDCKGMNLSGKTIQMDLDLDGHIDTFNMLQKGSGFLVLDRNKNGKVDDGSELFGPRTDNGFAELKVYDEDNNLWIDENDDIYKELKIWMIDEDGKETLIPLKEADIGAIYLDSVNSHFDLKDGQKKGRIARSGVFLKENGQAGAIHEVKL
ncbi:hypothetical protein EZV73_19015 [Acidaminobacter sp. JC074]|uniref:hypothetical protein n=1 Tax=Acidaminobacter sp. JC074 TaxID=2530199 RepID=UPI001F116DE0|nr:hypothetical protein [Acidaminobacter sp. JC074]MCH4889681.1 hypothetical protein [Acidaminobacter sp. JC074]